MESTVDERIDNAPKRIDFTQEVINLWVEVSYLRNLLSSILSECSHEIKMAITYDRIEGCRRNATQEVNKRFPNAKVSLKELS